MLTCFFFFKRKLGKSFVETTDAPDMSRYRLVDMFHQYTDPDVRGNIIKLFTFTISTKGSDLYNIVWPWNRLS